MSVIVLNCLLYVVQTGLWGGGKLIVLNPLRQHIFFLWFLWKSKKNYFNFMNYFSYFIFRSNLITQVILSKKKKRRKTSQLWNLKSKDNRLTLALTLNSTFLENIYLLFLCALTCLILINYFIDKLVLTFYIIIITFHQSLDIQFTHNISGMIFNGYAVKRLESQIIS